MIKAVVNIDIGCYEQIQEPSFENSTWDFYTITDIAGREHRKCTNEFFFEPVVVDDETLDGLSSKRKASYYKTKALTLLERETGIDYDVLIVLDGNIQITGDLDEFIDANHGNYDITMTKHPDSISYLQESQKIQEIRNSFHGLGVEIESEENMEETLDEMSRLGFKFNNGYHETASAFEATPSAQGVRKGLGKELFEIRYQARPTIIGFYSVGKRAFNSILLKPPSENSSHLLLATPQTESL